MATNPAGQSCNNCSFYIGNNCKAIVPSQAGSAPIWASPPPDDWCRFWNVWPQTGTSPAPAPAPPSVHWGQAAPSGGVDGDFWVQYTFIDVRSQGVFFFLTGARTIYYDTITIFQRQNGGWHPLVTNPA